MRLKGMGRVYKSKRIWKFSTKCSKNSCWVNFIRIERISILKKVGIRFTLDEKQQD